MISNFLKDQKYFNGKALQLINKRMGKSIENYTFLYVSTQTDITDKKYLYENISKSNFVLFKQYKEKTPNDKAYFIIGFQKTIIIIEQSFFSILMTLFSTNRNLIYCFLTKIDDFNFDFVDKCYIIDETNNNQFQNEILYFKNQLILSPIYGKDMNNFWQIIIPCISGYLIKESYEKTKVNRLEKFITNDDLLASPKSENINEDEFIELQELGTGSLFMTKLIYHIEKEELFVIKKANSYEDKEIPKLIKRELNNYSKINHPFLPKYIGTNINNDYIIMEFINGKSMYDINKQQFSYSEKITIIFELMIIIEYLHRNHFVYRDLKPNNIIIDVNNTAVLIDFDRMIDYNEIKDTSTNDFSSLYLAKEVNSNNFSYECDIYSLGLIIYYFIQNEEPSKNNLNNYFASGKNDIIKNIIRLCINEKINERPSILEIVMMFFTYNYANIRINNLFDKYLNKLNNYYNLDKPLGSNHKAQFYFGLLYENKTIVKCNFEKAIIYYTLAANANIVKAQFNLALIYYKGKLVKRDIDKAIYYFSLAANQNDKNAQYYLGLIYYAGKLVKREIYKSIAYFTLSANQNNHQAQFKLGVIYSQGIYVPTNINKAIHYLTLASNQIVEANFALGIIYEEIIIPHDINKSIYFYSLAANQNYCLAQYKLGLIYSEGKLITRNIKKSIYYYSLAANQNYSNAQYNLGFIYFNRKKDILDIKKAIYFFSLAAQQNHLRAQFNLGMIYYENRFITRNMQLAIYYFTLAANQNDSSAQFNLGLIYSKGIFVPVDFKKAIHYFTLSANQNHHKAQFHLGKIYYQGIFVPRDIKKAIHYLLPVANLNFSDAQFILGSIFLIGRTVPRDIDKAIHYLTLASNQNHPLSQLYLGIIFISNEFAPQNISKAIYYLSMAANQNLAKAQFYLGFIYAEGEYVPQDVSKAIFYYELAANQNNAEAQFHLGLIYAEGKLVPQDINKTIHYYKLASKQNHLEAQFSLGSIYFTGNILPINQKKAIIYFTLSESQKINDMQKKFDRFNLDDFYFPRDRSKGVYYYLKSANLGFPHSHFTIGYLYHIGICVEKDIQIAIHHYKEASSFNYSLAKNNLGIIYKHGIDEIEKNLFNAILYFEEAIKYGNINLLKYVAMYNLAHLYFYEEPEENSLEKAIKLLIQSSDMNFLPSLILLCIISFKKFGFKMSNVFIELNKYEHISDILRESMLKIIQKENLDDIDTFEKVFHYLSNIDFIYDYQFCVYTLEVAHCLNQIEKKTKNINSDFYEGFGIAL